MEFDREILGKYINIFKCEGPIVDYKYDVTDEILKKFFCIKRNSDRVLGKVLSQFGYTKNDRIYLTDILYKDNNIVINYEVNGMRDENDKIIIEFSDLIFKYKMIISDKDRDVSCKVTVFGRKNIEFRVSEIVEKLDNGNTYLRDYSSYFAKYKIIVNNKEFELELEFRNKLFDEFSQGYTLVSEKESELENYLKNIDVSLGIEDIYKDIVSYIGDDVKYLDIKLSIKLLNGKFDSKVTDIINVKDGNCKEFMVTRGNRCISIDKDGNCVSKYNDGVSTVITTINEDGVNYSISASNDILLLEKAFIYGVNEYENAINEINDSKKRILELVPKKK